MGSFVSFLGTKNMYHANRIHSPIISTLQPGPLRRHCYFANRRYYGIYSSETRNFQLVVERNYTAGHTYSCPSALLSTDGRQMKGKRTFVVRP